MNEEELITKKQLRNHKKNPNRHRYFFGGGDFADTCAKQFLLMSMGGEATPSSVHRLERRIPGGASGLIFILCFVPFFKMSYVH